MNVLALVLSQGHIDVCQRDGVRAAKPLVNDVPVRVDRRVPVIDKCVIGGLLDVLVCRKC